LSHRSDERNEDETKTRPSEMSKYNTIQERMNEIVRERLDT